MGGATFASAYYLPMSSKRDWVSMSMKLRDRAFWSCCSDHIMEESPAKKANSTRKRTEPHQAEIQSESRVTEILHKGCPTPGKRQESNSHPRNERMGAFLNPPGHTFEGNGPKGGSISLIRPRFCSLEETPCQDFSVAS